MPTSITPPPADDEVECANCGAYVYIELTRCPQCGVNLYEPDVSAPPRPRPRSTPKGAWARAVESLVRKLRGEPHPAEELFAAALREKDLFDDLVRKVGGDRAAAERLIEFERRQSPTATRFASIQNAIRRWEQENR